MHVFRARPRQNACAVIHYSMADSTGEALFRYVRKRYADDANAAMRWRAKTQMRAARFSNQPFKHRPDIIDGPTDATRENMAMQAESRLRRA